MEFLCSRLGLMIATYFAVLLIMKNCKTQKAQLKTASEVYNCLHGFQATLACSE